MKSNGVIAVIFILFGIINKCFTEEIDAEKFSDDFVKYYEKYSTTQKENSQLRNLKEIIFTTDDHLKGFLGKSNARNCLKCYCVVKTILNYNQTRGGLENPEESKEFLKQLCKYLKVDTHRICDGNVEMLFETFHYILYNKNEMTAANVCSILLQGLYCMTTISPQPTYEGITVDKPILIGSKQSQSKISGQLKILQLSDLHYDLRYAEGSNAECEEWICCRGPQLPLNDKKRAGKWGDYRRCDSPSYQIENLIKEAARKHKASAEDLSAIYITGDFINHFGWDKTKEEFIHSMEFVTRVIKENFPNIPVFPILGNHDSFPDNMFPPSTVNKTEVSISWIYEFLDNLWKDWLPEDAVQRFRKDGYYTTLLRPNLRIIALNSNMCLTYNLWLLLDDFYFREQLEWLNEVLQNASAENQKVHILSHVPSNDLFCYYKWTKEYKKIIERYTHIITGEFNGHSHYDEFVIYYAEDDPTVALNVGWNGGSGTNFPNVNSNYKVYKINNETYEVEDFETWIFNLNEANSHRTDNPKWFKMYSFKEFFGVPNLSPDSIDSLVKRMANDERLLSEYWRLKVKESDYALRTGCDKKCLANAWSDITRTYFDNTQSLLSNDAVNSFSQNKNKIW